MEKIREEICRLVPPYAQMNGEGQRWLNASSPMAVFQADGAEKMISFSPVVSTADEQSDADHPFTAILGTLRFHLGSGTRTNASGRICDFDVGDDVAICAEDADRLKFKDGDTVQVESRWGVIKRKLGRSNRMGPGQLFVPLAVNANDAMGLIDLSDLADPNSAGWKTCAVKIKKA
jgi:anaerobic selenocysteine-containing dehydrogenase